MIFHGYVPRTALTKKSANKVNLQTNKVETCGFDFLRCSFVFRELRRKSKADKMHNRAEAKPTGVILTKHRVKSG